MVKYKIEEIKNNNQKILDILLEENLTNKDISGKIGLNIDLVSY